MNLTTGIKSILGYCLVGLLWGCSNPFVKYAQRSAEDVNSSRKSHSSSMYTSLIRLVSNSSLFLPFMVNQSGSLVFYYLLSSEPVSRASPICNALTFVITALTGHFAFGEKVHRPWLMSLGVALILIGIALCVGE